MLFPSRGSLQQAVSLQRCVYSLPAVCKGLFAYMYSYQLPSPVHHQRFTHSPNHMLCVHVFAEGGALLACNQESWRGWRSVPSLRVQPHNDDGVTVVLPGGSHALDAESLRTHDAAARTPQDGISRLMHALRAWPVDDARPPDALGVSWTLLPLVGVLVAQRYGLANVHWLLLAVLIYVVYSRALAVAQVRASSREQLTFALPCLPACPALVRWVLFLRNVPCNVPPTSSPCTHPTKPTLLRA